MSDFSIQNLLEHTRILSVDWPNRFMGEAQEELAARYIADQLESYGLVVHLSRVPVLGWEVEDGPFLQILEPERLVMECAPCFYSGSTESNGLSGRLEYFGEDFAGGGPVYKGEKADTWPKYAIVPEESQQPSGFVLARPNGPVIARNGPPAGSTVQANGPLYTWPSCTVRQSDGERIREWTEAGEKISVRYFARTKLKPNCTTTIVRGEIGGAKYPDEVIILGAHHDSMGAVGMPAQVNSPGACDNASAVSILIELARIFSRQKLSRTLWLCSFGGEERNLIGSNAYVRILNEQKQLGRVIAYLGVDQAAYGNVLRLLSSADEPHLEPQVNLQDVVSAAAADLQLSERFDTYGPGPVHAASDHWPFFYSGIPAFLTGWHPFDGWHRHTDTYDLCTRDEEYLATADLLLQMLLRVCELSEVGFIDRSPAAGYILYPPAVET